MSNTAHKCTDHWVPKELSSRLMWLIESRMPAPTMQVLRNRSKRINQLVNRNTRG